MSTASPAPAMLGLKSQLMTLFPVMKAKDLGIMADARHIAGGTSDHIGGNAIDIPAKLTKAAMKALALIILRDPRVHYVIWDRVFYHEGKKPAAYTGSDPHTGHIHVSIYPAKRAITTGWVLENKPQAVYDTAYYWINGDISSTRKAEFVEFCNDNGLKLVVLAGEPNRAWAFVHVGERKRGAVVAKLTALSAIGVTTHKSRGGGTVAPDATVRRLNTATKAVL